MADPVKLAETFIQQNEERILRSMALDPADYCLARSDTEVILCKLVIGHDDENKEDFLKVLPASFHTFFDGLKPEVQALKPFFGFDHRASIDAFKALYGWPAVLPALDNLSDST